MKLLSPCKFAWDPAWAPRLYAINPYLGCPFDCTYCWAKAMAHRFKREPPGGWGNVQVNPVFEAHSLDILEGSAFRLPASTILIGATCDPYPPLEKSAQITQAILWTLKAVNEVRATVGSSPHKILVLTKSPIVCRDWELLREMRAWVGFSITAPAGVNTRAWEPYAPSNASRIAALKFLHKKGVKTFASLEPWLVKIPLTGRNWEHDITRPAYFIRSIANDVDYFILGGWNKGAKPLSQLSDFYRAELPFAIEALKATGKPYWIKPELLALKGE